MMGRADAPQLNLSNRLNPQATPVDTYASPARAPVDDSLDRLSKALEGFSTSIYTYGQVAAAKQHAADKDTLAFQEAQIGGMSREQLAAARKDGTLPAYADKAKQAGIDGAMGLRQGALDSEDLQNFFKTQYDPAQHGTPQEYIQKKQREAIAGMPVVAATQYIRQTNPVFDWVVGYQNDQKNKQVVEDAHTATYTLLGQTVTDGIKAGQSPEDIQKSVRSQYPKIGQKGLLGVDNRAIDESVLAVARDNAQAHPEVAMALVATPSVAPDGTKLGFLSNPRTAERAQAIISEAAGSLQKKAKVTWENAQGSIGASAILSGNYAAVDRHDYKNPDGSITTMSQDDFNKKSVQAYLDASPKIAKERHEDQGLQLSREIHDLRSAGLVHPKVQAQVNGIASRLVPSILNDPEEKEKVLDKLKTGQFLLNQGQNSLHGYTEKAEDRDAISVYNAFKTMGQNPDGTTYSDEQALTVAMEIVNPAIRPQTNFTKEDQEAIDSNMDSIAKGQGWFGWGSSKPANSSAIENKLEYMAKGFIASGLSHEDAIAKATKAVQDSSLIYNGVMLPSVNGFVADSDFQPTVKSYIDDWAKQNPKTLKALGIDADDIAILPMGNVNGDSGGHFRLVTKSGLSDILDDSHNQVIFNANDLRNKRAADKRARNDAAIRKAAQQ